MGIVKAMIALDCVHICSSLSARKSRHESNSTYIALHSSKVRLDLTGDFDEELPMLNGANSNVGSCRLVVLQVSVRESLTELIFERKTTPPLTMVRR